MEWFKRLLRTVLTALYKVEVRGIENLDRAGARALIVANHTSFLDALFLAIFLPGEFTFAVNTHIANSRWLKPLFAFTRIFPMDPTNPLSIKSLVRYVKGGRRAVIFPEGRITVTGSLMKVYDGPGMVADKANAPVVPVRIDGAQFTPFSRLKGRVRLRWFPKVTLTVLEPRRIDPPESVRGRERRKAAGEALADIMTEMVFATSDHQRTLFQALLDARNVHGGRHPIVEDIGRRPLGYHRLIAGALTLGRHLKGDSAPGEHIGLLLPGSNSTVVAFMALQAYGRVPAMLNFTAGTKGMIAACQTAEISTVLTSRRFIETANLGEAEAKLRERVELIYLEDVATRISALEKFTGWVSAFAAGPLHRHYAPQNPNAAAVILFTSGSEGTPKGVVLSHTNLLANRDQLASRVDFSAQDIILNALPLFHSFGLTAGTLLPLFSGMKTFFYPSPLHYRIVPEIAYDVNATVMFGTNTFLSGYARFAHPYDFYSVRYVFAGAEKLTEETRRVWSEKFGVRIFEGYGATETSPVLAANTPMESRPGSVGRFLPGITYRLVPVPGVSEGGRLHVAGPNIMRGYLLEDTPGALVPPASEVGEGWYDTGDIVTVDEKGFVTIRGRAKRFAKVGGEMVSLTAVEEMAAAVWPDAASAAVALPDPRKGEQVILISERPRAARAPLQRHAKARGIPEISVPKRVLRVKQLPLLGTGKLDYSAVQKLAEASLAETANEKEAQS